MKFGIVILHERRNIRLTAEMVSNTPEIEKFKVTARNTTFILQSNRPMLISKGLKHKPINWKVVEGGGVSRPRIMELITDAIEIKLKQL